MSPHAVFAWFDKEILPYRLVSSVVRGLVYQAVSFFVFNSLLSFSPLTPISWVTSNMGIFLSPRSWLYDLIVVAIFSGLAVLQSMEFSLVSWVPENRLQVIKKSLKPQVLLSLVCHVGGCGLLTRCYLGLQGRAYNNLITQCHENSVGNLCLNEGHIFLVMSGCFLGICFWINFHFRNGNLIEFPLIPQSGNAQLRRSVGPLLKSSMLQVVSDLRWFYLAYFLFLYRIENFLSEQFGLELMSESSKISLTGKVYDHLSIFVTCWSTLTLLRFSLQLMIKVIMITTTKPLQFQSHDGVVEAMKMNLDLIGHLACQDFAHLAETSKERRSDFFVISLPGGHPHNWKSLKNRCVDILNQYLSKLNESSQILRSSHQTSLAKTQEDDERRKKIILGDARLHDIVTKPGAEKEADQSPASKFAATLSKWFLSIPILSSPPDTALRNTFAQSQPIIWIVEGLSHLISASLNEDQYGIIQQDLQEIFILLITLQQTVDRQKGLASFTAKKKRCETRDQQLKYELRAAMKTAIYRIVVAFGEKLEEFPWPAEHQQIIRSFVEFKEG